MTLQKQIVQLPLDGGQNDAAHEFASDVASNLEVTDGRYLQSGAIAKRFGIEAATTLEDATPGYAVDGGLHTITEHGGRLVAITHDGALAEDEAGERWERLGATGPRPSQLKSDPIVRGNNSVQHPDMAILEEFGPDKTTIACTVWRDSEAGVCMYAWHELPGDGRPPVLVFGPKLVAPAVSATLDIARTPRVAQCDGTFLMIGTDDTGTNLNGCFASPSSSYEFGVPALVDAALTDPHLAAIEVVGGISSDKGFWCVFPITGSNFKITKHTTSSLATVATKSAAGVCLAACYVDDSSKNVICVATATGALCTVETPLGAAIDTHALITPAATIVQCATVSQASIDGRVLAAWSGIGNLAYASNGTGNFGVDVILVDRGTYAGIWQTIVGQVRLGGHACWDGTDRLPTIPFVNDAAQGNVATDLPFWSGYLGQPVLDSADDWKIAQVASYGIDSATAYSGFWDGIGSPARCHCMPSMELADGSMVMPYAVYTDVTDPFDLTLGLDMLRVMAVDSPSLRTVSAQGLRITQSGAGAAYTDGMMYAEMTPAPPTFVVGELDPDMNYGGSSPSGGGGSPAATLYVSFAIRWRDAQGNVHRSIPTLEQAFLWWEFDSPFFYGKRWLLPRPFPGSIQGDKASQSYEVELYQADAADGTMYFRGTCTPIPHPTLDAFDYIVPTTTGFLTEQNRVSIVATPSGVGTVTRWTDLGELQHIPPPPLVDVCSTQARLWALSAENGRLEVWASKLLANGFAPEFPPEFIQRIPAEGGECTALAALDDKVVVFKERAVFVLFGDPGDNTGNGSTLETARLVSSDVGCSNPRSVVEGPFGVAFQASSESASGRAGIHVLGRDLSFSYPGIASKGVAAGVTFGAGTLVPAEKEVRWIIPSEQSGDLLVWSYDVNRWHVHTSRGFDTATMRRGRYAIKVTDEFVSVDLNGWDATSLHAMQIVTPWIKVAGLQGFQRCWSSTHLFKRFGSHIKIEIAYDYSPTWDVLDAHGYSTDTLNALSTPPGPVQVMLHHRIQKCQSLRFRITEDTSNDTGSQGLEYLGCALEVGVKRGTYRKALPPAAST